jgi:hypothetical protein
MCGPITFIYSLINLTHFENPVDASHVTLGPATCSREPAARAPGLARSSATSTRIQRAFPPVLLQNAHHGLVIYQPSHRTHFQLKSVRYIPARQRRLGFNLWNCKPAHASSTRIKNIRAITSIQHWVARSYRKICLCVTSILRCFPFTVWRNCSGFTRAQVRLCNKFDELAQMKRGVAFINGSSQARSDALRARNKRFRRPFLYDARWMLLSLMLRRRVSTASRERACSTAATRTALLRPDDVDTIRAEYFG